MIVLNIDPKFAPFNQLYGQVDAKIFNFSSGFEPHVQLLNQVVGTDVLITCRFTDGNDLMRLLLATDAVKRWGASSVSVFIPFLPFARQDHIVADGDALSLRVFADVLNAQNYRAVILFDPHSDAAGIAINGAKIINNYSLVGDILVGRQNYRVASTDANGYKRTFPLMLHLNKRMGGQNDLIICDKVRDKNTGKVISTTVNVDDLEGSDVILIDDILDGGRTFIMIAEELIKRNVGHIDLIVSHYIGSNGEDELKKYFRHIYTTNSVKDVESSFVIQTPMKNIIIDNINKLII